MSYFSSMFKIRGLPNLTSTVVEHSTQTHTVVAYYYELYMGI